MRLVFGFGTRDARCDRKWVKHNPCGSVFIGGLKREKTFRDGTEIRRASYWLSKMPYS